MMVEEIRIIKRYKPFILGFCACGCKKVMSIKNKLGFVQRFIHGHNTPKGKDNYFSNHIFDRENHWNWKGGIQKYGDYLAEYDPYHPKAHKRTVAQHRLVYERYYNCCLLSFTQIHHKDKNKKNNSIENLIPIYNGIHRSKYHRLDTSKRFCLICKSKTTYYRKDRKSFDWTCYKDGFICRKCHRKLKYQEKKRK